jgi:hypothetical protein
LFLAMSGMARAATFTVSTPAELSNAIAVANFVGGGNTINFAANITLTSGALPAIDSGSTLTINGNGFALDGDSKFQIFSVSSGATLSLQFLTLQNGSVTGDPGEGGAILNNGTLTVTGCTLSDNQSTGVVVMFAFAGNADGGAIYNHGTLTVTDSTLSANQALGANGFGGAIHNSGTLTVTNSTFSANQATGPLGLAFGGAILNEGTVTVTNSTFSGNQTTAGVGVAGGAIYNTGGTVSLKGSILADSTPNNCNITLTASFSIADDSSCFTNGTDGNEVVSTSDVGLDPLGLQNNGGPTQTIALEADSKARGLDTDCTDQEATPQPVFTDQRLFSRPDSPSQCDSGAYEYDGLAPIVLEPNSERLQIARSTKPDSDQVNLAFTFTENGFPMCDAGDDAFNGFTVLLRSGSCGALIDDASLELMLEPWVVHTVNHQSYGTLFQSTPPETVSARMVQLPTPASPACGEWAVNIEVAGIDSSDLGNGPFALILSNPDGDTDCFDITNAIVGNQINPPTRTVRRGVRR